MDKKRISGKMRWIKHITLALVLDDIDMSSFYSSRVKKGDYGDSVTITEFEKMKFYDSLCSMPNEVLIKVFEDLKTEIDSLLNILS